MNRRRTRNHSRDPEASRRRLLEAGVEIFSERGPDGGSVSMIAAKARINRRMLYHYYGSKEGLYRASLRHVYGQMSSTEVALADMVLEVEELLERLIRAEYAFLASHPQHVRLLTWENLRRGKAGLEADFSSFKAPILEALRIALDRGQREGRFRADVDEKQLLISCLALSFFYFANQYTLAQALGFDLTTPEAIERRIRHVVSLILDGIRERNHGNHSHGNARRRAVGQTNKTS